MTLLELNLEENNFMLLNIFIYLKNDIFITL